MATNENPPVIIHLIPVIKLFLSDSENYTVYLKEVLNKHRNRGNK